MQKIREQARKKMQGYCRVCPVCNGKVCAGEVPGMGGIGTGAAFQANCRALAAVRLNMRLIHDVTAPDTREGLRRFTERDHPDRRSDQPNKTPGIVRG